MSHTPWSQEQAEKWAVEIAAPMLRSMISRTEAMEMIHEALAKAAEMIEACETVVQMEPGRQFGWYEERKHLHHKYHRKAKLVGVQKIEVEK